jgi:hypothetical protein
VARIEIIGIRRGNGVEHGRVLRVGDFRRADPEGVVDRPEALWDFFLGVTKVSKITGIADWHGVDGDVGTDNGTIAECRQRSKGRDKKNKEQAVSTKH